MKLTSIKSTIAKLFTVGLLAGAVAVVAPTKAEAQFGIAVHVGPRPIYGRAYYGPYYGWDHRAPFAYRHEDRRFYR